MFPILHGMAMTYDMADQPRAISGGVSASYQYDGNLKRVKSVADGKTIYNVYDLSGALVHVDEVTDATRTDYVTGPNGPLMRIENGNYRYLHADHLGSAHRVSDASGTILANYEEVYSPYGMTTYDNSANDNQAGFTGHIRDKATGLNYMQARYYDPLLGRFLSIDPVGFMQSGHPGSFNRYAYTFNDPINHTDPDGEFAHIIAAGVIGGLVGGGINAFVQYKTTGSVDLSDAFIAGAAAGGASALIASNPAFAANPGTIAAITGTANLSGSVASDLANGKAVDPTKAVVAGLTGFAAGPLGAKAGDFVENALGASASSVVGEIAGATLAEGAAAGVSVGTDAAKNAVGATGQGLSNLADQAGQAMTDFMDNPTGGPDFNDDDFR